METSAYNLVFQGMKITVLQRLALNKTTGGAGMISCMKFLDCSE